MPEFLTHTGSKIAACHKIFLKKFKWWLTWRSCSNSSHSFQHTQKKFCRHDKQKEKNFQSFGAERQFSATDSKHWASLNSSTDHIFRRGDEIFRVCNNKNTAANLALKFLGFWDFFAADSNTSITSTSSTNHNFCRAVVRLRVQPLCRMAV